MTSKIYISVPVCFGVYFPFFFFTSVGSWPCEQVLESLYCPACVLFLHLNKKKNIFRFSRMASS